MFIVIEGVDGSGKSTIVNELYRYCCAVLNKKTIRLKFPRYESPYGEIITNYLNGEYKEDLNPWIMSVLFDCDKFDYKLILKNHIENHDIVILDRYFLSNIVYSCARMKDKAEREKVISDLIYLNTTIFEMPLPDVTFVLDIDENNYSKIRKLREYDDIHENNLELIIEARKLYNTFCKANIGVEIPYIPIEERLELILNHVRNL